MKTFTSTQKHLMTQLDIKLDLIADIKIENLLAQPEQGLYDCGLGQTPPKQEPLSVSRIENYLERQGASFKWEKGRELELVLNGQRKHTA
jgi:hypothetical protein